MVAERRMPEIRTLGELRDHLEETKPRQIEVPVDGIRFHLSDHEEPWIDLDGERCPKLAGAATAFGNLLGVPLPFMRRLSPRLLDTILNDLIQDYESTDDDPMPKVRVIFDEEGVERVVPSTHRIVPPREVVALAIQAIGTEDAELIRLVDDAQTFSFDARTPETFPRWVGGDPGKDVSVGALRFTTDRRRANLAPSVARMIYRLEDQSAFLIPVVGLKVDARNRTVDKILKSLRAAADEAIKGTPDAIAALYDLRNEPVEDLGRMLRIHVAEEGLAARTAGLLQGMAVNEGIPEKPTQFDLVCLMANAANLMDKDGGRQKLELAAGRIVGLHAERCGSCKQKLVV